LAIARSIVKRPKILILDEATSSIDVRSELMVQAALDRVSKDRTTITIAHRLATVKKADNIIVLRKGKLVQQGTHEELMADEGGAYWTLATAQQLVMSSDDEEEDTPVLSEVSEKKSLDVILSEEGPHQDRAVAAPDGSGKPARGLAGSFGLLLREQSNHWGWYIVLLVGAVGGGGKSFVTQWLSG
jgi:ABC-type multidrug transport system ATPase subunit